jgi:serine protease AprX
LVVAQEHHIPAAYSALDHGTLVGALAASGGGFPQDASYFPIPVARLLDIQLLGSGAYENIDEDDLIIQVEDAVTNYGPRAVNRSTSVDEPVVVWNLSLGGELPTSEDTFSLVAMELDRIAQENQVVFTIAAGNYTHTPLRSWIIGNGPSPIPKGNDRISSPADSALSISVGSLSDTSNPPTAAPAECPSPFSRRGPGPGMLVKPDLVHYGGTYGEYKESVRGILGPHRNGIPLEDIGTSFSTPRVASQLAELVGMLPNPEPELL